MGRRSDWGVALVAVGTLIAFGYGVAVLLRLGAGMGSAPPPYSTYRSDPLGMKALYESLDRLPGVRVERNLERIERLEGGPGTTVILGGVEVYGDIDEVERPIVEALERLASEGTRVVLAFAPDPWGATELGPKYSSFEEFLKDTQPRSPEEEEEEEDAGAGEGDAAEAETDEGDRPPWERPDTVSLAERWGVRCGEWAIGIEPQQGSFDFRYRPVTVTRAEGVWDGLPEGLPWHTALHFETTDGAWRPVYMRDPYPVMMERAFGAGSLVLSADSYFLSNEALLRDRAPGLIAWLAGPAERVVFDEWLKGFERRPGVMGLMRRYGLHGVLGGLLLTALLFVWHRASPLVPPPASEGDEDGVVAGRDTAQGLSNLLQRNIPRSALLRVACEQWLKEHPQRGSARYAEARRAIAETAEAAGRGARWTDAEITARYNALARLAGEQGGGMRTPGTGNRGTD